MTLILGFAAPPGVVMVADRRLSTVPGGAFVTDKAIKLVMFCNQMVFGYTGLAFLEGKRTDEWLASELANLPTRSVRRACEHIQKRANEVFSQPTLHGAPHAFVGVGFAPIVDEPGIVPLCVDISNMYEKGFERDKPRDAFALTWQFYEKKDWRITYAGVLPTHQERTWVTRRLRKLARKGANALPIVGAMRDLTRMVSARCRNRGVGKSLLVAIIPKTAALSTAVGFLGPKRAGAVLVSKGQEGTISSQLAELIRNVGPQFLSIPEDSDTPVHDSPILVCPKMGILKMTIR